MLLVAILIHISYVIHFKNQFMMGLSSLSVYITFLVPLEFSRLNPNPKSVLRFPFVTARSIVTIIVQKVIQFYV